MNPDHIRDIITAVKTDTTIAQPWRNKAIARLEESIAFIEFGHSQTAKSTAPDVSNCTCPAYPDAINATCPIHANVV